MVATAAQIQPAKAFPQNRLSAEQNQVMASFMEAEFGKDAAALIHVHSPRVKIQYLNSEFKPVEATGRLEANNGNYSFISNSGELFKAGEKILSLAILHHAGFNASDAVDFECRLKGSLNEPLDILRVNKGSVVSIYSQEPGKKSTTDARTYLISSLGKDALLTAVSLDGAASQPEVHIKVEGTKLIFNPGSDYEEFRDITRIHAVGAKIELVKGEKDAQFACVDLKAENPKTFQMQKSGELNPLSFLGRGQNVEIKYAGAREEERSKGSFLGFANGYLFIGNALNPTMISIDKIREITTPQENGKNILDKFIQVRKSKSQDGVMTSSLDLTSSQSLDFPYLKEDWK